MELSFSSFQSTSLNKNEDLYLLVTGEGIFETLSKVSATLAKYQNEISSVHNYGVAGALHKKLDLDQIVKVQSVCLWEGSRPGFKIFKINPCLAEEIKCISSMIRIVNDEDAAKLRPFSAIVDMELWGLAKACDLFKIPLESTKLISDYAGVETVCVDIKKKSLEYSQKLFDSYQQ